MLAQRHFQHADTDPKKSQFLINLYGTNSRKQRPIKYSPCFVEKYREVISRESVTGIVCTQRASNWAENTDFGRRIIAAGRKFAPLFSPSIQPCSIISDCLWLCSAPLRRCLTFKTDEPLAKKEWSMVYYRPGRCRKNIKQIL